MEIDIFCAWGDGPDVGVNMFRGSEHWFLDLSADEADAFAEKLKVSAAAARELDRSIEQYMKETNGN